MKKYSMSGVLQSETSNDLNPYMIKTPIAPNPSFVPSSTSQMKKGGQIKKCKKC